MRRTMVTALGLLVVLGSLVAGCSSDDDGADDGTGSDESVPASDETSDSNEEAGVPGVADQSERPVPTSSELTGGDGPFLGIAAGGPDLDEAGYEEVEYVVSGIASSYAAVGELPADGTFELEPADEAEYATRILVRRPASDEDFNGTVVVEWLNVSGGVDAAPDYTYLADELLREGYAWVGVSAQHIGVEGGPTAVPLPSSPPEVGAGLKAIDPDRYGGLDHPGDAFAYDIYTQVGRLAGTELGEGSPLEGLAVQQVLGIGESQSAFALTTYVNGVQPLEGAYDGFLIHSRGGAAFPLGDADAGIGIADAIGGQPTTIRTDGEAPIIVVQTEGDLLNVLGSLPARQPDADTFRMWEVAGAAHADRFQVGDGEVVLGCSTPINRGQQVFVLRSALHHLNTWAAGGDAPPAGEPIEVDEAAGTFVFDEVGNVLGGVRTPVVDAPTEVLSGLAPEGSSVICLLMGSTTPLPDEQLTDLWPSPEDYEAAYEQATDAAIEAGFILEADRDQVLAEARTDQIPS